MEARVSPEGSPMTPSSAGIKIPFTEHLGVQLVEMTREHAVVSLQKRPELLNSWGATHGGVVMTMLDLVMSWAVRGYYGIVGGVLTVDLSVGFMKAGLGPDFAPRRNNAGHVLEHCPLVLAEILARETAMILRQGALHGREHPAVAFRVIQPRQPQRRDQTPDQRESSRPAEQGTDSP